MLGNLLNREKIIVGDERAKRHRFSHASTDVPDAECIRHRGVGWLLLLNIPKPNENLAWPAAQLHRDLFEVLFGSFLHLGNIGE